MKKIILLAAFLHFFIAPLTYHPDNKLVLYWAGLDHGNVWNIWQYGEENFPNAAQFNYPPLHFYLDKLQFGVASVVGGPGFYEWLSTSNNNDPHQASIARYSVAIKFVLILFGLSVGYLIFLLAKKHGLSDTQAKWASCLWLFNPIVLYSIPMMGQNDVMAILFFLIGWLLLDKSKIWAMIVFGLSASIKMYPLLWLPFLLVTFPKFKFREKAFIFAGSILVYVMTLLPFLSNQTFREVVLNSDLNDRFFIGQIDLGFDEAIMIVPLLLIVALYAAGKSGLTSTGKMKSELLSLQSFAIITCNLLLLGFSHFHPQWFTWIIPFWSLWVVSHKSKPYWLISLISLATFGAWLLIVLFFNDTYLTSGILIPINRTFANLPLLRELFITKGIDVLKFNNFAHTWLAIVATLALLFIMKTKSYQGSHSFIFPTFPKWHLPKFIFISIVAIFSVVITYTFILITYLIPIPQSSPHPKLEKYIRVDQTLLTSFTALENNLTRVDLYFINPGLANKGEYTLQLFDATGVPLAQQNFSGFNTGDPSSLRFNFPPMPDSQNKEYQVVVRPLTPVDEDTTKQLQIALTSQTDKPNLAIKSFYSSPRGLQAAATQATNTIANIVRQLPLYFIGVLILLILALL